MYACVIKNGTVGAVSTIKTDIAIQGQQIIAIGENSSGLREIDVTGQMVILSAVDIYVHSP